MRGVCNWCSAVYVNMTLCVMFGFGVYVCDSFVSCSGLACTCLNVCVMCWFVVCACVGAFDFMWVFEGERVSTEMGLSGPSHHIRSLRGLD